MKLARFDFAMGVAAGLLAATASLAAAQDFPSKPTRIVVPAPAGSGTDAVARLIAERLSRKWPHAVVVENISGGSTNIGAAHVARADPDGHTLMFSPPNPISINRHAYKNPGYDQSKFVPVALIAKMAYVLITRRDFPASTVQELVAVAKAKPGTVTHASPGVGSTGYLASIQFEALTGAKLAQVPYRGLAPALTDISGGHVDMMFDTITTSLPLYRADKIKIIAATSPQRIAELPNVPTVMESGVPKFQAGTWFGMVAPEGTPDAVADKIHRDVSEILRSPDVNEKIRSMNMQPQNVSRAQAGKFFADESAFYGEVIKQANIQPQ